MRKFPISEAKKIAICLKCLIISEMLFWLHPISTKYKKSHIKDLVYDVGISYQHHIHFNFPTTINVLGKPKNVDVINDPGGKFKRDN